MVNNAETLASFVLIEDDITPSRVVDRSTLQNYAECPARARFIDSGAVNDSSWLASAGEEIHKSFSAGVAAYVDLASEGEIMRPSMLADVVLTELRGSRPDVQPDALAAAKHTAWSFARLVCDLHPLNLLRWDGGAGEHSGQLSWDLDGLNVRVTSELDLLVATESPRVLRETDYKSGWRRWSVGDVARSFQFQLHAWLVLLNYPDVDCLEVQVWDVRRNGLTYPVEFRRRDLGEWHARIANVAGLYVRYEKTVPDEAPVWPSPEKCSTCPAAALCPASKYAGDVARDPPEFVARMFAVEAQLEAMKKLAGAYVDATGNDIQTATGCYGVGKPKTERKPTKTLYVLKSKPEETDA